jgi:RNA polymerase sporulation-specific sigma factor
MRALAQSKGEKKESQLKMAKELAKKDLPAAVVAAKTQISLEELVEMTETVAFSDQSAAAMFEQIENRLLIKEIVKELDAEDRLLIYCRYFLKKSQAETGEIFHLSQGRISRKEKEILSKLRRIAVM